MVGSRLTPCRLGPDSRGSHSLFGANVLAHQAPTTQSVRQCRQLPGCAAKAWRRPLSQRETLHCWCSMSTRLLFASDGVRLTERQLQLHLPWAATGSLEQHDRPTRCTNPLATARQYCVERRHHFVACIANLARDR